MTAKTTLYNWFSDLKKPTGAQFKALIDSFFHKSEKIPMTSIEGLENVIQGTASAEQLRNHLTDSQAHKGLFDGKVDKEAGKGLSSNDFTNTYKQRLDNLEDYDIELDENTTELRFKKGSNVVRRISLMFLDDEGTKLVYNKPEKTLELRDKRNNLLTSIPVSHFVSNIPDGIVVQNGKIKLMAGNNVIFENAFSYNDLADKPDLNFAPASHRHNWDDIDGKPEIATEEKIKEVVKNIKIGGRNYALNSKNKKNLVGYVGAYWKLSEPAVVGKTYTFSCYANVENGKRLTMYFSDIHGQPRQYIVPDLVNGYNQASVTPNYAWTELCAFHEVSGISPTPTATIEKVKFEIGDKDTDWSPAPEDLENKYVVSLGNQTRLNNEHAGKVLDINTNISILDLSGLSGGIMISIIKTVQGAVTFSGKTIIGDNAITGGVGSTASIVISPELSDRAFISVNNK
ncbi:hypothetical protein [Capnocytophaga gingivalis]|uniref:hypothetical protein n=1 Tax=Capnocytophaga gingivalis TaxID=1017 RepID=UPI003C6F8D77